MTLTDVRLGDWRDVLPGTYDPAHAVVVTDPPYGLASGSGNGAPGVHSRGRAQEDTRKGQETGKGYEDTIPWAQHVIDVLALLPAKRHVIRGPATTIIRRDYPQPRRVCVEVASYRRRAASRPGVVPYLWQGWCVYGRLQLERHKAPPRGDGYAVSTLLQRSPDAVYSRKTDHRALTPYPSALWITDTWVDPGDVVIDPFAGHGTIGQVARALGFDYLGAERVPEYHAVAVEGFTVERMTLDLRETA